MQEQGGASPVEPTPLPASGSRTRPPDRPQFAHASEAELARILDFYAVRWEYEPHTFPILWNLDGAVVESFSPDFHLPDFDTYIELTTLRQPLVRKKNRKLRRLRELYPDIRIKLFYARDFRALMLKYGKLGLVDALSGTSGQVTPGHDPSAFATPPAPDPALATAVVASPRRRRARASAATAALAEPGAEA
jgi:hypoxanthine phosphoribosyltransferase